MAMNPQLYLSNYKYEEMIKYSHHRSNLPMAYSSVIERDLRRESRSERLRFTT